MAGQNGPKSVPSQSRVPSGFEFRPPTQERRALDYPPVRNGVDYLISVVDHLTADPLGPRHIKYAVLHLQAAAEVLLKARLGREHWSLVFDDPGTASEKAFRSGDFKSCTVGEAVTRLRNIVGVPVAEKDQEALATLGRDRNALQHYGLSHNTHAVEARAGRVLDFLVRFLDEALLPGLELDEIVNIQPDLTEVRRKVTRVQTFITQRLRRLRGDLQGREEHTVRCPRCAQLALIVEKDSGRCLFCDEIVAPGAILNHLYLTAPEGVSSVGTCPRCHQHGLAYNTALATGEHVSFCFWCVRAVTEPDTPPGPSSPETS